jgi:NADH-quinone oxidoreductase subunit J
VTVPPFLDVIFWVFSGVAVLGGVMCITRRNPVHSALWLVVTLFAMAGLFVLLDAQFLAVLQVIVYAGAIMVLFLFVIMLLNLGRVSVATDIKGGVGKLVATLLAGGFALQLLAVARLGPPEALRMPAGSMEALQREEGLVAVVGRALYGDYLVPFEITSVLLLAAIVGAVVLAKRRL